MDIIEQERMELKRECFSMSEMELDPALHIDLSGRAYAKMMTLILSRSTEVGWYGTVVKENDELYRVADILVQPQRVSAAYFEDADEEFSRWLMDIWEDEPLCASMKLCGHSHVNFASTPSSIDINMMAERRTEMRGKGMRIFMIWNKRNERWAGVFDFAASDAMRTALTENITVDGANLTAFLADSDKKIHPMHETPSETEKPKEATEPIHVPVRIVWKGGKTTDVTGDE